MEHEREQRVKRTQGDYLNASYGILITAHNFAQSPEG